MILKKTKRKNFPDEDINKVVENAKDALSKTINPNNPENNNETFKTNLVLGYIQSGKPRLWKLLLVWLEIMVLN